MSLATLDSLVVQDSFSALIVLYYHIFRYNNIALCSTWSSCSCLLFTFIWTNKLLLAKSSFQLLKVLPLPCVGISPTRVPSYAGSNRSTSLMSPKLVCWVGDSITRHSRTSRTPSQLTSTPMIIGRLASGLCPMYAHHHKPDEDPPPLDRHHGEEEEDEMKQKSQNLISVREAFQNFKRKTKIQIVSK